MATRMQQRRGTYSQWNTANPILNAGEVGWESDFNRFKIGDGINHWQDLPYFIDETALGVTLGDYVEINLLGVADGVAELGGDGKLKAEQMPTTVDSLTLTGNLTVNGSTVTVNATEMTVDDKNITLGATASPNDAGANGGGITLKGTTDKEFKWVDTNPHSWYSSENIDLEVGKQYHIDGTPIKDVSETLANKTINLASNTLSGTVAQFNTALSDGNFATLDGSETLTNKTIHNAVFTGSQSGLQLAFNQTLVFEGTTDDSHEMTLSAGDPTVDRTVTLPDATGTIALVQNKLSDFAATTSAEVASVVSDETGSGSLVFSDSATLNNVTISGATVSSLYLSDSSIVIEGTANDHETTLTVENPTADRTITFPDATGTVVLTTTVDEMAQDAVNTALVAGTGLDKTYDDVNNTITLDIDSTVTTNSGAQTLTNKTLTLPKINDGADVTANSGEINILDGATLTTAELNILDGATLSTAELNILDGATITTTELNYIDGVTSSIQTQIDSKLNSTTAASTYAPIASPTFTGTVSGITKSMVGLDNVDNTSDANKPVSTATQTALDAKLSLAGGTMTGALTLSGNPSSDLHAATKSYVDNIVSGINFHQPVRVATTANITLSGTQTIDGVSLSVGDRVLVKDQTDQKENGIYVVASSTWSRATDADNTPAGELAGGDFSLVLEGTVNSGYGYVCSNTSAITIGSTNITYSPFNAAKAVIAGNGLQELIPGTISIDTSITQTRVSGVSDTEIGYLDGVTSAIQTQLDAKIAKSLVDAKGDLLVGSANDTVARLAIGTDGYLLTADSASTNGVKWAAAPVSLPSQTGNSGKYLTTDGSSASWATIPSSGADEVAVIMGAY